MSGDKMLTLYEDLKTSGAEPHLLEGFEDALGSLLKARIIGWGIRYKLQMLCPQEDE